MNGRIFRAMLVAQARYVAPFLGLGIVAAVAVPMLTVQGIDNVSTAFTDRAGLVLNQTAFTAPFFPILALCLGCFIAVATWLPDIAGRWVYVLTLPVDRVRLAALRLATGVVLILPVALALWLSALFAVSLAGLGDPIIASPGALALRFFLAAALTFFVVSPVVLFSRRTWIVLVLVVLVAIISSVRLPGLPSLVDLLFLHDMSPLHPLAGQWRLFDV
jgi:hypothetical protein